MVLVLRACHPNMMRLEELVYLQICGFVLAVSSVKSKSLLLGLFNLEKQREHYQIDFLQCSFARALKDYVITRCCDSHEAPCLEPSFVPMMRLVSRGHFLSCASDIFPLLAWRYALAVGIKPRHRVRGFFPIQPVQRCVLLPSTPQSYLTLAMSSLLGLRGQQPASPLRR